MTEIKGNMFIIIIFSNNFTHCELGNIVFNN